MMEKPKRVGNYHTPTDHERKNLRPPWPKGVSGNPGGRPRHLPMTERYREVLEELLPDSVRVRLKLRPGATIGDAIALAMARLAVSGVVSAVSEITDRVEGRALQLQSIEHTGVITHQMSEREVEEARESVRKIKAFEAEVVSRGR